MGLLSIFKIYVFSAIEGTVLLNGEPVEGATLMRTADHMQDKVYRDTATTNANGQFSFNAIHTWSLRPLMLETVIHQKIIIQHQGKEYLGWDLTKRYEHHQGEIALKENSRMDSIKCTFDLAEPQNQEQKIKLNEYGRINIVWGLCKLQNNHIELIPESEYEQY